MNEKKTKGVIYYNVGYGAFIRLAVSLLSCRKHYSGPISVLCDETSYSGCWELLESLSIFNDVELITIPIVPGRNSVLLNKCLLHKYTPYDYTLYIDADTVILQNFEELFDLLDKHEFFVAQFSSWSTKNSRIRRRIKQWSILYPDKIKKAFNEPKAINTGIFGFTKDSKLMNDWYGLAEKGRNFFICDETCCQLILPDYNYTVIGNDYNVSCRYDKISPSSKIIHFHGRKHARISKDGSYLNNCKIWYDEFFKIKDFKVIKQFINNDRQLRRYYQQWTSLL